MAYHNKKFSEDNFVQTGLGIGPHDFLQNAYDANNNITSTEYYRGGLQGSGTLIARVEYTYDSNQNLITVERVS